MKKLILVTLSTILMTLGLIYCGASNAGCQPENPCDTITWKVEDTANVDGNIQLVTLGKTCQGEDPISGWLMYRLGTGLATGDYFNSTPDNGFRVKFTAFPPYSSSTYWMIWTDPYTSYQPGKDSVVFTGSSLDHEFNPGGYPAPPFWFCSEMRQYKFSSSLPQPPSDNTSKIAYWQGILSDTIKLIDHSDIGIRWVYYASVFPVTSYHFLTDTLAWLLIDGLTYNNSARVDQMWFIYVNNDTCKRNVTYDVTIVGDTEEVVTKFYANDTIRTIANDTCKKILLHLSSHAAGGYLVGVDSLRRYKAPGYAAEFEWDIHILRYPTP
jgi:hypothetical protein